MLKELIFPSICFYEYENIYYDEVVLIPKKIRLELTLWFDVSFYTFLYMTLLSFFVDHSLMDAYYWLFIMNSVLWLSAIAGIYIFHRKI